MKEIVTREEFKEIRKKIKTEKRKLVFTNGCFDVLHAGHVDYLRKAKEAGDYLVVALNSDSSVSRIKGEKRPIIKEDERAFILANLKPVDFVVFFEEETPAEIINEIIPDVLIKGADWPIDKIVGRETVEKNGGEVKTIEFVQDQSTSKIIDLILSKYGK